MNNIAWTRINWPVVYNRTVGICGLLVAGGALQLALPHAWQADAARIAGGVAALASYLESSKGSVVK